VSAKVFVAEFDGTVIGFLSFDFEPAFHREGRIGTITAMCVLENMRGQGIGSKLIEQAEAFAIQCGCVRIAVASGIQRHETHQFYLSCGYKEKTKRFVKDL
jgi:GNAT superfamily N-acetyltransferase